MKDHNFQILLIRGLFLFLFITFLIIGFVSAEELYVPSTALGGVKYIASSPGIYRVTYVDGAARGPDKTPSGDCGYCIPNWPCWTNQLYIYKNRDVSWGPSDRPSICQPIPASPDYSFGDGAHYSLQEAEMAAQGHFFDVSLNSGDWLVFTIVDFKNSYETNSGGMTINISPILTGTGQTDTVGKSTSSPPSPTSAPIITISPSVQIPPTNSGDSSYYFAVISVLIIVLCVVGVYSIHMTRKKSSVNVTRTEQKPLAGGTSFSANTEKDTKFRSSSEPTHHDIFISYSSEDKPIADAICNHLESRQIRCWVAPRDILPGMNYQEAIIDAIDSSSIMVLVFSSHSNKSPHVLTELNEAMSNGTIIIPFRTENILPSKAMKYLISIPHWLDAMTPPLEHHIQELEETIRILIDKERRK